MCETPQLLESSYYAKSTGDRARINVAVDTVVVFRIKTFVLCNHEWILHCTIDAEAELVLEQAGPSVTECDVVAAEEACIAQPVVALLDTHRSVLGTGEVSTACVDKVVHLVVLVAVVDVRVTCDCVGINVVADVGAE